MTAAPSIPDAAVEALTFGDLRAANIARQEHWGGSDNWTLADWSNALAGEVGEACNVVKKIRRPQLGTKGNEADVSVYQRQLASEIGDVLIYLDLLALKAGVTLEHCVLRAFNEKSEKLDMPVRLSPAHLSTAGGEAKPVAGERVECPTCRGRGELRAGMGAEQTETCWQCYGKGSIPLPAALPPAPDKRVVEALRIAAPYVEQAVKDDGGIDNCDVGDRLALEKVRAALARPATVPAKGEGL